MTRSTFSLRDAALLGTLALLWGNSFLFIKSAVAEVPPVWIVAGRLSIGGALLAAVVLARRQRIRTDPSLLLTLGLIGTVGSGLPWLGQAWAQQSLDSGLVAVLNATTPVMTMLLAVAVGQERLSRERIIGLSVAILGTVIVIGGEVSAGGPVLALLTAALATFGYGVGTVIARAKVTGQQAALPSAATQLVLGATAFNLLGIVIDGTPPAPWDIPPIAVAALLGLGALGTGLAFVIYFTLIERVGATNASMVTYLVPVVGLIAGAVVRGERFGLNVLLGAAVLIGGVWLAQRTREPLTDDALGAEMAAEAPTAP